MASSYVKPVSGEQKHLDQGVDFQGKPGDPVVAVGLARVAAIKPNHGGFGTAIYYTLLDGPDRGRQVYVGHAQPTVHVGQLLKPGDQVATLLEHPLGNAAGLPGWVEIGFAKDGVPDPGTAKQFLALVESAGVAPVSSASASTSAPTSNSGAAGDQQPTPPAAGADVPTGTAPTVDSTTPLEPPPGSGITSTNSYLADLWNRIASQPGSSPDAQLLASNAQVVAGG